MGGRTPNLVKQAEDQVTAARRRLDDVAAEYGRAFAAAIERSRLKTERPTLYKEAAVLVTLTTEEARLRRELQAATVQVTEAEQRYRAAWARALVAAPS